MYHEGKAYSTINLARSALSSLGIKIDQVIIGSHPIISRLMKGIFNKRPTRARYTSTWDADEVLQYLRSLPKVKELSLKQLTLKLTMLIALTQAARPQTIHLLTTRNMAITESKAIIHLEEALKHTRPSKPLQAVVIEQYPHDEDLCTLNVLKEYMIRTKEWRIENSRLILSHVQPHKPVSRDTIRRWLHTVMKEAGIDTQSFGPYSTRSASASKAAKINIHLDDIMKTAGWTRQSTFNKFYNKDIIERDTYANQLLNSNPT